MTRALLVAVFAFASRAAALDTPAMTLSSEQNPVYYLNGVVLIASVTSSSGPAPTGTVQFFLKGWPYPIGSTAITLQSDGSALSPRFYPNPGIREYEAQYSGDDNYAPATASFVQTITGPTVIPTITIRSAANPSAGGQPVTISATVTGDRTTATGTVTFREDDATGAHYLMGVTLDDAGVATATLSLPDGGHAIFVQYSGDDTYWPGQTFDFFQQVGPNPDVILDFRSSANPSQPGDDVIFTINASKPDGSPAAFGRVQLYDDRNPGEMTADVDQNGVALFTLRELAAGIHHFSALFIGYPGVGMTVFTQQVVVIATTATMLQSSANPATEGQAVMFMTSVQSIDGTTATGTVTFFDGSDPLQTVPLAGGQASLAVMLSPGMHTITASYSGDGTHLASTSAPVTQSVLALMATTTTLSTSKSPSADGEMVTLTVAVQGLPGEPMPTGNVALIEGGVQFATLTLDGGGRAKFSRAFAKGTHAITAVYSGSGSYRSSTAAATQVVVAGASRHRAVGH